MTPFWTGQHKISPRKSSKQPNNNVRNVSINNVQKAQSHYRKLCSTRSVISMTCSNRYNTLVVRSHLLYSQSIPGGYLVSSEDPLSTCCRSDLSGPANTQSWVACTARSSLPLLSNHLVRSSEWFRMANGDMRVRKVCNQETTHQVVLVPD